MLEEKSLTLGLPSFAVASDVVGGACAFAGFQAAVVDVFTLVLPSGTDLADYRLTLNAWHLGTLMIGDFRSGALWFERSGALVAAGGLDHLLVQVYLEGGFVGTAGKHVIEVRAGDIVVFDLTRTLSTEATAFRNISILVPRTAFEAVMDDVGRMHGAVMQHENQLAGLLSDYLRSLVERLPHLSPDEAIVSASATVALAVSVLAGQKSANTASNAAIPSPFRTIAMHIDAHLQDPDLDADKIAPAVGLSRASLYRLFEPFGGVAAYIRRRRLIGAALALTSPANRHRRIGEIAFERGFSSEATFTRAFRQAFGLAPSVARSRAAVLLFAAPPAAGASPDHDVFARWMRSLQA